MNGIRFIDSKEETVMYNRIRQILGSQYGYTDIELSAISNDNLYQFCIDKGMATSN